MASYVDAFEEAGLLQEFTNVLDYVDSALAVVGRHGPPSAIARMLMHMMAPGCSTASPGNTADMLAR